MATDRKPGPRARGLLMPRFEARVLAGTLLAALPTMAALLAVLWLGPPGGWWGWAAAAVAAIASVAVARWQYRRVMHPLYTLASLIEALREGDYSLRGARHSVLGGMVADINQLAETLQAERLKFEETSSLLGKTLAALESAVFVFDQGLCLRLMNPAGQQLLDDQGQDLFGCTAAELDLADLLETPASRVITRTFPGRTGRFEIRHAALRRDGHGGRLLVISDVGHVLRAEERQAWQRLLRVLGHEVNNSLAPIQSMADTLASIAARDPLPEDWREDLSGGLEVVRNRAAALSRFLAGYARLARLPPPHRVAVDLSALLRKVVALEQRVAVTLEEGEAITLDADADQLEQALINLLRNGADASLAGRGGVRVRWFRKAAHAVVEIDDDGLGAPSSDNLFVPFFTTKPGGSGIGLALVRQIAEAHEGGVSLTPREGTHGARATLWLPCVDRDQGTAQA